MMMTMMVMMVVMMMLQEHIWLSWHYTVTVSFPCFPSYVRTPKQFDISSQLPLRGHTGSDWGFLRYFKD